MFKTFFDLADTMISLYTVLCHLQRELRLSTLWPDAGHC